jgi:Helicase subunit of the DNA excision repair complex
MFKINSKYKSNGDQPHATEELVKGVEKGEKHQILLGATILRIPRIIPRKSCRIFCFIV